MSQKIDGSLPVSATVRSSSVSKVSSAGEDRSSPIAAASAGDSLRLTGEASHLQAVQRNLSQAPAIDANRVQAVKDALQSGSYKVNADTIASRLLDLDKQLGG
ncbi:MAG: flagellar biosynthesis anti-sigma factor FlgM [Gammaproteobacteria bacterium]